MGCRPGESEAAVGAAVRVVPAAAQKTRFEQTSSTASQSGASRIQSRLTCRRVERQPRHFHELRAYPSGPLADSFVLRRHRGLPSLQLVCAGGLPVIGQAVRLQAGCHERAGRRFVRAAVYRARKSGAHKQARDACMGCRRAVARCHRANTRRLLMRRSRRAAMRTHEILMRPVAPCRRPRKRTVRAMIWVRLSGRFLEWRGSSVGRAYD